MENLFGCNIHSADRIHPEWQSPAAGSAVNLALGLSLVVACVIEDESLVLRGGVPVGAESTPPSDFTWCFALFGIQDGSATRLVVRERYTYLRPWAQFVVRPATVISSLMSRKMLAGISKRVQQTAAALELTR
ncbi:MAG: hypothetical protein WKF57_17005 [Nakamurella sp.]